MNLKLTTLLLTAALAASCGSETTGPADSGNNDSGGYESGGDDHGEGHELGDLTVGPFEMTVTQFGGIEAGAEGAFDVQFPKGSTRPDVARAWIGIESGVGSRKARLMKEPGNKLHGHVEVPDPIPADSKLWIEIDQDSGAVKGGISLHR